MLFKSISPHKKLTFNAPSKRPFGFFLIICFFFLGCLFLTHPQEEREAEAALSPPFTQVHSAQYVDARFVLDGTASWYSRTSPGIKKRTANNEVFNDKGLTCAMWGSAFNQKLRVTNLANGKSVVVRVNDRGPHGRYFRQGRVVDLTKAAFSQIASPEEGLIQTRIEFL